jgi:hypothetical protein
VVPWNTLGLAKTDAVDPWGRYVFYRVYDGATGFTRTNGLNAHDCLDEETSVTYALSGAGSTCNSTTHENSLTDFIATKGLTVEDMGSSRTKVAYVLISPGESGFGGYYPGATAPLTTPAAASKEFLNAGSGGTYWITAASAPSVAATDDAHFDDIVSYAFAVDLEKKAGMAGRAWALSTIFTHTNLGVTTSNYNTGVSSLKVATSGGPIMVTAAADSAQKVCGVSSTPEGVAACTTQTNGNNLLITTNNERLIFDFRVTRRYAVLQLTEFRASGGGDNERALITFYNGSTQVDQQTVTACATSGGERSGLYRLTAAADFTKIEVRGTTKTGGGNSDLGVAAIMACKIGSDCPVPPSYPAGWSAPVC